MTPIPERVCISADGLERDLSTLIQEKIRASTEFPGGPPAVTSPDRLSLTTRVIVPDVRSDSRRLNSPRRRLRGECNKVPGRLRWRASQDGPRSFRSRSTVLMSDCTFPGVPKYTAKSAAPLVKYEEKNHRAIVQYFCLTGDRKKWRGEKMPTLNSDASTYSS